MALGAFGLSQNNGASDLSVTGAGTFVCAPIVNLIGMQALLAQFRFVYGAGGTSVKAFLQGSADQGNTWYDMACVAFAQQNRLVLLNLSALTPQTALIVPLDGSLADNTAVDGLIPDRVRLKAVVEGVYSGNTVLAARMVAR